MARPRTTLLYGDTGTGKTSCLYHSAKLLVKSTKKKVRVVTSDGGGAAPFYDSGMIDRGEVEICDLSQSDTPFADMRRIGEGYWPIFEHGRMIHFAADDQCAKTVWSDYIAYMFEGLTSLSDLMLGSLASRPDNAGFKHSWRINEGEYSLGGLQEGHYGIVQQELRRIVVNMCNALPVRYVFWTALVGKGKAARTAETIYGPKAAGDAITERIPSWFNDTLHIERFTARVKKSDGREVDEEIIAAWFRQHLEPVNGLKYLAKCRITPEYVHLLDEEFPNGFVPLDSKIGFGRYMIALQRIEKRQREDQKTEVNDNAESNAG